VWAYAKVAVERRDPQVLGLASGARVADVRRDHAHADRSPSVVVDDDDQRLPLSGEQIRDVPGEREPASVLRPADAGGADRRGGGQRDCQQPDEPGSNEAPPAQTDTTALFGLSGPRQFAVAGVTVYCQVPDGTLLSVQVSPTIVPVHALRIVCRTPVEAL
jgi:hypothetical protein